MKLPRHDWHTVRPSTDFTEWEPAQAEIDRLNAKLAERSQLSYAYTVPAKNWVVRLRNQPRGESYCAINCPHLDSHFVKLKYARRFATNAANTVRDYASRQGLDCEVVAFAVAELEQARTDCLCGMLS